VHTKATFTTTTQKSITTTSTTPKATTTTTAAPSPTSARVVPPNAQTCYSVGDPHMSSFDNVRFDTHAVGWQTLYEKGDLKIEAEQAK